jgi:putative ABC transport system permease protein
MFRNYLTIASRNLVRNKVFSTINILGLAVGLTCGTLILLWVQDELSWDRFHKNIDQLYRVYMNRPGDNGIFTQTVVPLSLWEELKNTPGVKYVTPTNTGDDVTLAYEDMRLSKSFYYGGPDFLKMFDFPLLEGSPNNQLDDASSIVITKSTAEALFGHQSAIGKVVRMDNKADLTVSGVVEDPPSNSTLQFQCVIPFKVIMSLEPWYKKALSKWDNSSFFMYIDLEDNAHVSAVETRIRNIIKDHAPESKAELMLFPLQRSRLYSEFENGKSVGGTITYVRIFAIIAVLILALACINFTNLATARSEKRAKEVGIRKTVGSNRRQLVFQFLSETMMITILSFGITIGMVEGLLPFYNNLVGKSLSLDFGSPVIWGLALAIILVTGLASGSYPAFFLSSFKPVAVLKGRLTSIRGNLPRKIMVTTQFFFSIGLVIGTIVIYSQLQYVKNRQTGYDINNLLTVPATGDIQKNYESIKRDLLDKSLAKAVTVSSSPITDIQSWSQPEWQGQREDQRVFFGIISIGYDYTKTLGTEMLLGRDFDATFNDSTSVLLNESAVNFMGIENPVGTTIRMDDKDYKVAGVIKNVVMTSPYGPASRTLFFFIPNWTSDVLIRLPATGNIHDVMEGIGGVFKKYNPNFPFSYAFVDQEFNKKFAAEELIGNLANTFAILAIFISCLGLFGLSAFAAEQRTKEVGIRKVMGASVLNILTLFSKDFSKLILIAFLLAAPLTWWFMHQWLLNYTYRVTIQWWMILGGGILGLVLTWVIVGTQAIRASLINPSETLRME